MPLKGFICPDNKTVLKEDCINKCRIGNPCRSLRYLLAACDDRPWTGKPSCTQLINGTRMEFLKITKDYFIKPDDRAFAILGTRSHWLLDKIAKTRSEVISEYKLEGDQVGTLDCLEPDRVNGGYVLIDNKTWGSYSVRKSLDGDMADTELQLNFYRVKAETDPALAALLRTVKIHKMLVEAIVRDGGTIAAKGNNVTSRIYSIPVKRLPDDRVLEYFNSKSFALHEALEKNISPSCCTSDENWNWRRCRGMCDVAAFCPEGRKINKL